MKYTYQYISQSGSFVAPYPNDVQYASSRADLERALNYWEDQHWRCGSDRTYACLWVAVGIHDSMEYPDWIAYHGPRGGFNMDRA